MAALGFRTKPYDGADDPDLPPHVKELPADTRRQWIAVFNDTFEENEDDGEAMKTANAAVKEAPAAEPAAEAPQTREKAKMANMTAAKLKELAAEHGHAFGIKCGDCAVAVEAPLPYGGAVSYGELDAIREADEYAMQLNFAAWDFQDLLSNIFGAEDLTADEKAAAIVSLAEEFKSRVRTLPEAEKALLDGAKARRTPAPTFMERVRGRLTDMVGAEAEAPAFGEGFKVYRTKSGARRWVAYSANAFEDIEGELFETKALENAVAYGDLVGERGPLRLWHVPGADVGFCDYQAVAGKFLVESGVFYDNPAGQAAVRYFDEHKETPFGVSLGFVYVQGDEKDGNYSWIRIKERSVTPPGRAASPFTSFTGGIPMTQITKEKQDWLAEILGSPEATRIVDDVTRRTKALEDAGIRNKAAGDGEGAAAVAEAPAETQAAAAPAEAPAAEAPAAAAPTGGDAGGDAGAGEGQSDAEKGIAEGLKALVGGLDMLNERMKSIEDRLGAVEKSDDEKIAAAITPRGGPVGGERPSASDGNVIDGAEKAIAAIRDRVKDGETEGEPKDPAAPYVGDIMKRLGIESPAGAAAS